MRADTRLCPGGGAQGRQQYPEVAPAVRELQVLQYIVMHQALDEPGSCLSSSCDVTRFRRLHVPCGAHHLEGLWRGTYGGHGLEIITLRMQADGCTLRGCKVTGDPNVPHSQVRGWPACSAGL